MKTRLLDLFEFEAVLDAPADGGGTPAEPAAPAAPDGGGEPAPAGVPAAPAEPPAGETPAAPAIDWASPEAQAAIADVLDAREQQAEQARQQATLEERQQTEFSDIEEAFGLLGITPDRLNAYLGRLNEPLQAVAEQVQQQQAVEWVDQQLKGLAPAHPDLLGDGLKLAELTGEDGQPLFNEADVALGNRNAVLFAAAALNQAGVQDHSAALAEAAKQVSARDEMIGRIAVERFKRELQAGGTAAVDLSGGATGGVSRLTGIEGGDELAVARRINAERSV
jgi:hypothetical protein